MENSNNKSLPESRSRGYFGSISVVTVIMVFAKLSTLAANQVYMSYFGTADVRMNIYSYALSLPNIIFNCVGTALSTVVIPIYAALITKNKRGEANRFVCNIISVSGILTMLLICAGYIFAPLIVKLTSFSNDADASDYAVTAIRILLPVMLFYGLNYIFQGVLQSLGKYTVPALVTVPSSICVIGYVIFLAPKFSVTGLLYATVAGLFLQFAILVPPAVKAGFRFRPVLDLKDENLRRAGKMTLPVIAGAGAYQLNMLFGMTLAANFEGTVTLLTFVQNLVLNSCLTLVYAITAVMYPTLSTKAACGDTDGYKKTLFSTVAGMMFILIPLSVGMAMMRTELLSLISGYGKVTADDIGTASGFLLGYSLSVAFIGLKECIDRAFYSLGESRVSAIGGILIMAENIALCLILTPFYGAAGIPLAYALSTLFGCVYLCVMLAFRLKKQKGTEKYPVIEIALKTCAACAVMAASVYASRHITGLLGLSGISERFAALFIPVVIAVAVYFGISAVIKNPLLTPFTAKLTNKFKRGENKHNQAPGQ